MSVTMTYLETDSGQAVIIARDKLFQTMKEAMGTLAAHYRTQLQPTIASRLLQALRDNRP